MRLKGFPTKSYLKSTAIHQIRSDLVKIYSRFDRFSQILARSRPIRPNIGTSGETRNRTDTNPKPNGPELDDPTIKTCWFQFWFLPTRKIRVGQWVSSPKTWATRPDHKINKIRWDWKVFRQRATWNPPDPARSTPNLTDPAKYRLDQDRSSEILAPAAKYQNQRRNPKPNRHQPETQRTRTGWSNN